MSTMWIPIMRFLAGPFSLFCSLALLSMPRSSEAHPILENITVTVPEGTNNHGDPHLLCTPARWGDFALFFLGNYFAHAATVKSLPGEPAISTLTAIVLALIYPTSGVFRGFNAILQSAIFCRSPLKAASRAEALCMVVRALDWKPRNGDTVRGLKIQKRPIARPNSLEIQRGDLILSNTDQKRALSSVKLESIPDAAGGGRNSMDQQTAELRPGIQGSGRPVFLHVSDLPPGFPRFRPSVGKLSSKGRKIHGKCILPPGYDLVMLPPRATVYDIGVRQTDDEQMPNGSVISECLSCSYSFSRALVAVIQTIFASVTLYRSRGDQIQRYGYAAFGLTVTPYLVMSIANLIGTMVTPDYPTVYMIRSDVMDEASTPQRGGRFEGIVGSIESSYSSGHAESFNATFEETPDGRVFVRKTLSSGESGHDLNDEEEALEVCMGTGKQDLEETNLIVPSSSNIPESNIDMTVIVGWGSVVIGCIAIAIIGGLSHFRAEKSTTSQRAVIVLWLGFGILRGPVSLIKLGDDFKYFLGKMTYSSFAIAGFVIVGMMLKDYGSCVRLY